MAPDFISRLIGNGAMLTHAPETAGNDLFDVEDAKTTNANVQSRAHSPGKPLFELSTANAGGSVTIANTAENSGDTDALNSATSNTIVVSSGTIVADLLDEPDGGWILQKDMMQSVVVPSSETLAPTTSNTVMGTSNLNLTDGLTLDLTVAGTVISSGSTDRAAKGTEFDQTDRDRYAAGERRVGKVIPDFPGSYRK
jgi:hypothetical protein